MRNYEGMIGLAQTEDPILRRNLYVADRYLRQLNAVGFASGQPPITGANGGGHGGEGCCQNEVDEFEVVHDATEGVLSFGRVSDFGGIADLTGHTITRVEGGELGTFVSLNGDSLTGAVTLQTTTVHTGTYAFQIAKAGAAANFSMGFAFDSDGQVSTTQTFDVVAYRAWIRFSTLPDATRRILTIEGAAGADQTVLSLTSGGILSLDGNLGSTVIAINTWYEITGVYDAAGSGSHTVQLMIEGGERATEVTANPTAAGNVAVNIVFGSSDVAGTYTMFVDDIVLEAGASTAVVTYPLKGGVYGLNTTANGALASVWSLTGAATRWEAVKVPHDGDTSYIAVSNAGDRWQSFTQTPASGVRDPINAVQFCNITRATTTGNYVNRIAYMSINSSSSSDVSYLTDDTTIGGSSSFQLVGRVAQLNPVTSAEWTNDGLEAILLCAYADPAAGVEVRISTISAQVDVGTAIPSDYARAIRVTGDEGHIIPAYLVQDGDTFSATEDWARLVAGHDGTNAQIILTDTSGRVVTVGGGGITVDLADDAAFTIATSRVMPMGALADEAATDSVDEGDIGVPRMTLDRKLLSGADLTDDAAFGIATSKVNVSGFLADETATDSVDEGDVGAARMTLDRKILTGSDHTDDAAFSVAAGKVSVLGGLADETATDSVDEGDVGAIRMTLDRKILTGSDHTDDAAFGVATGKVSAQGLLADESGTDSVDEGDIGIARMTLDRRAHVKNTDFNTGAQITTDGRTAATTVEVYSAVQAKDPGANTISRVSCEVANLNDDGTTSDRGLHVSDIPKYFRQTLTALNVTYDDSPTTASSATIDCSRFRQFLFFWTVTRANAPTDIQVKAEFSNDGGTTWFQYRNNFWGQLLYDDIAIPTSGTTFSRCYSGDCVGDFIRFTIVCQGTTGGGGAATFTVSNATCILKN